MLKVSPYLGRHLVDPRALENGPPGQKVFNAVDPYRTWRPPAASPELLIFTAPADRARSDKAIIRSANDISCNKEPQC